MKPHHSPRDYVYLAELLVIGSNMTMYVLFYLFPSYHMGLIYGSLWGVLPSNPYITPVISCDVFGVPPCWGLSWFQPL